MPTATKPTGRVYGGKVVGVTRKPAKKAKPKLWAGWKHAEEPTEELVQRAWLDGYSFGDRLLEDCWFEFGITPMGTLQCQVREDTEEYLKHNRISLARTIRDAMAYAILPDTIFSSEPTSEFNELTLVPLTESPSLAQLITDRQVSDSTEHSVRVPLPFTPRVQQVLLEAAREARKLKSTYVSTEHVLLGFMKTVHGRTGSLSDEILKKQAKKMDYDSVKKAVVEFYQRL